MSKKIDEYLNKLEKMLEELTSTGKISSKFEKDNLDSFYGKLKSEEKQELFCKTRNIPFFAPENGICYKCHKYIYDDTKTKEKADKENITGCPFCNKSFVE